MTVKELIDRLEDIPSDTVVRLEVGPGRASYYAAYGNAQSIEFDSDDDFMCIVAEGD